MDIADDVVSLTVADDGPGVEPEQHEMIFRALCPGQGVFHRSAQRPRPRTGRRPDPGPLSRGRPQNSQPKRAGLLPFA